MDTGPKKHTASGSKAAAWFNPEDIDKTELDHFGDSLGSEEDKGIYKKIRNAMVSLYRAQPGTYLTVSSLKRLIPYDFCLLIKIHSFLESWELINCDYVNNNQSNIFSRIEAVKLLDEEDDGEKIDADHQLLDSLSLDDSLQLVLAYLAKFVDENFVTVATLVIKALLPYYCSLQKSDQLKGVTSLTSLLDLLQTIPELSNINQEIFIKFPCVDKLKNTDYKLALLAIIKLQQGKILRKARINDYFTQMTEVKIEKIDMQLDFLDKYEAVMNMEQRMLRDLFRENQEK